MTFAVPGSGPAAPQRPRLASPPPQPAETPAASVEEEVSEVRERGKKRKAADALGVVYAEHARRAAAKSVAPALQPVFESDSDTSESNVSSSSGE